MARSKNQGSMSVAVLIVFGLLLSGVYGVDKGTTTDDGGDSSTPVDTCNDGVDNDNDGMADGADPECDPSADGYDGTEDVPDDMGPPQDPPPP